MTPSNHSLFLAIHGLAGHNFFADIAGIFFAEWLAYFLVAGFLVLVFMQKGARRKIYLFAEGALATILARGIVEELIHLFYHEPRPFAAYGFAPLIPESGWGFPSGHMMFFFALAIVVWFANRKWGWWYLGLAAACGFARIYTGVHWPFDIMGGVLMGLACGVFIHWLLKGPRTALAQPDAAAASPAPSGSMDVQ